MKTTAIVLAGGSGKRMKTETKKQYLPLLGRPVLFYSLYAFEQSNVTDIVIVAPEGDEAYVRKDIVEKFGIKKVSSIVSGGKERSDSVYEGIKAAIGTDYVLVHDGARPLIEVPVINKAIEEVQKCDAVVVGVKSKDTIHIADPEDCIKDTPDRSFVWVAQTPQCFEYRLASGAFERAKLEGTAVTDDAMVIRKYGDHPVKMLEGSYTNIKITTPEDMEFAKKMLAGA